MSENFDMPLRMPFLGRGGALTLDEPCCIALGLVFAIAWLFRVDDELFRSVWLSLESCCVILTLVRFTFAFWLPPDERC